MTPLLLFTLVGCFASPFEGTWLFQAEREQREEGDCAGDDDTRLTGTDNYWVDIYKTGSGELVVLYSEALIGTGSATELSARWDRSQQTDDTQTDESIQLEATLAGGVMTGTVTGEYTQAGDGDSYRCTTRTEFSAERNVSAPTAYPED